jgi:hypothetical protein
VAHDDGSFQSARFAERNRRIVLPPPRNSNFGATLNTKQQRSARIGRRELAAARHRDMRESTTRGRNANDAGAEFKTRRPKRGWSEGKPVRQDDKLGPVPKRYPQRHEIARHLLNSFCELAHAF